MKLNEYLIEKEFQKKNAPSDMICYPIVRGNCLPILACANKKKVWVKWQTTIQTCKSIFGGTFNHTNKFLILFAILIEKLCFNFILPILITLIQ